jgi:hypothetical protein
LLWAEKLTQADQIQNELQGQVGAAREANDSLSRVFLTKINDFSATADDIEDQIAEVRQINAKLSEDYGAQTEAQSKLHAELQAERVVNRQRSAMMLQDRCGASAVARALAATGDQESAAAAPAEEVSGHSLDHLELWAERASWLQNRVAGAEEFRQLQEKCSKDGKIVTELYETFEYKQVEQKRTNQILKDLEDAFHSLPSSSLLSERRDVETIDATSNNREEGEPLLSKREPDHGSQEEVPAEDIEVTACDLASEAKSLLETLGFKEALRKQERVKAVDWEEKEAIVVSQVDSMKAQIDALKQEAESKEGFRRQLSADMSHCREDITQKLNEMQYEYQAMRKQAEDISAQLKQDGKDLIEKKLETEQVMEQLERAQNGWCRKRQPKNQPQQQRPSASRPVRGVGK